jgi:molybdopterin/thiamine biosynthesis adenylyltransferase
MLLHEETYRGAEKISKLAEPLVTVCGAGAIGSHLCDNLARQGFLRLRVIDRDRVEQHNVSTQIYGLADVGGKKVDVLRNRLFRAMEIEIDAISKELDEASARAALKGSDIVVDAFDNSASRRLVQDQCRALGLACLHVGLHADYCEIVWDELYRVPQDVAGDVCEYPLARNVVLLAVVIATETLIRFVLDGVRESHSATLLDYAVRPFEPPVPG